MAKTKIDVVSDPRSGLLPDPRVADRYQVTSRTIADGIRNPTWAFPSPSALSAENIAASTSLKLGSAGASSPKRKPAPLGRRLFLFGVLQSPNRENG
jgi:alkanesulfonate monooxygenase SsuD/methylene tetrahydromethanopterin reductase-like flavin-dependent oxidoreductase (luciferase family)